MIIRIPFDVPKIWGTRGQLRVKGEINGFAFRTSLFPTGKGYHYLLVNKRMQAGANASPGTAAHFRLEPDIEERRATVPRELNRALARDRSLRRWIDQLNYSTRKEIGDWITQVKSDEARVRRAEQITERLLATMEAEKETPAGPEGRVRARSARPRRMAADVALALPSPPVRHLLLPHPGCPRPPRGQNRRRRPRPSKENQEK